MKKYTILVAFILVFSNFDSFGQVYEKIYELSSLDVQDKINQNKISGINILAGIQTHHVIGLSGISLSQRSALESIINGDSQVISYILNDDVTSVIIESKASLTKESFIIMIQPLNALITGYSAEYYINEQ
jgi:hypothetical protein